MWKNVEKPNFSPFYLSLAHAIFQDKHELESPKMDPTLRNKTTSTTTLKGKQEGLFRECWNRNRERNVCVCVCEVWKSVKSERLQRLLWNIYVWHFYRCDNNLTEFKLVAWVCFLMARSLLNMQNRSVFKKSVDRVSKKLN